MTSTPDAQRGFFRGLFSRTLHAYFLLTRGLTLGVRAVVRSEDGQFLLVRHTYTPGWHFPGGGVEKGETTLRAVEKELRQETGLRLNGAAELHGVFYNNAVNQRDHVLVYLCAAQGTLPSKSPSAEIAEIGFFDIADLPESIDPGTLRRIREIVDGIAPSEIW